MEKLLPPLPTLPITSQETLRKCAELPVGDKDIFIASFPKSGTTWMQNIVYQLVAAERSTMMSSSSVVAPTTSQNSSNSNGTTSPNGNMDELPFEHISDYAPFYDIDAHWDEQSDTSSGGAPRMVAKIRTAHERLGYRISNTHLRWDMLPHSSEKNVATGTAKYIYVVRDGRDVLTSFYHHLTNQHVDDGGFDGDFESFFQQFLDGTVAYGRWSHHLASWMPHIVGDDPTTGDNTTQRKDSTILLVRYEDLKTDLKQQVIRIADFLKLKNIASGATSSSADQQLLDRVLEKVSFEWMREHQDLFHPISVRWKPDYNFIRKGHVGDHDCIFDEVHKAKFMASVVADFGGQEKVPDWLHKYCFHH